MKPGLSHFLSLFLFLFGPAFLKEQAAAFAQRGKDGVKTVTAVGAIVNEFTALSANALVGNSTISVVGSALNSNGRFSGDLAPGDLVMIIQMQGAAIRGNA